MKKNQKLKRYFIVSMSIALIILVLMGVFFNYYNYTKKQVAIYRDEITYYQDIAATEQAWIADMQLSFGAIPFRSLQNNTADINPYFSSIAARALLYETGVNYTSQVKRYIVWMLNNLNDATSDPFGVDGTMSNFKIIDLSNNEYKAIPYKYDSVDSYSALMISLIKETYTKTNDINFLMEHKDTIIRVFNALLSTRVKNGLSSVSINNSTQYTMDNVEVNYGIKDGLRLLDIMLKEDVNNQILMSLKAQYTVWLEENTLAIERVLWNKQNNKYNIAFHLNENTTEFSDWANFYPDAVAQLFPIIFEVLPTDSARAIDICQQFNKVYKWEDFIYRETGDFYWTVVVYLAAMMEDEVRVKAYLDYYKENFIAEHPYPLYNAEAAWIINACEKMIDLYTFKINKIDPFNLIK